MKYVVKYGETLGEIAARYDVPLEVLAKFNNIIDVNKIFTGQLLYVPLQPRQTNPYAKPWPTLTPLPEEQ